MYREENDKAGNIAYQEQTNIKKPTLDKQGMLHLPVLPLSSGFIAHIGRLILSLYNN
jgi:hypothetical protein